MTAPTLAYRTTVRLATAYLLASCPRCKSWPGLRCQTSSGFYGGASGPHAARRKAVAGWSEAEVLAGWDRLDAEQAAVRAAWESRRASRAHTDAPQST